MELCVDGRNLGVCVCICVCYSRVSKIGMCVDVTDCVCDTETSVRVNVRVNVRERVCVSSARLRVFGRFGNSSS